MSLLVCRFLLSMSCTNLSYFFVLSTLDTALGYRLVALTGRMVDTVCGGSMKKALHLEIKTYP